MPTSTDQVEVAGAAFVPVCVKAHGGPSCVLWPSFNQQLPKQFPSAPVRRIGYAAPPSDHIPLRRRCAFGGSIPYQTAPSCGGGQRAGPLAAGVLNEHLLKQGFPPQ